MNNIQTVQRDVTPGWAEEVLTKHYDRIDKEIFRQRPISPTVVFRYATEMMNGFWMLTPDPISFDVNGDLINGQHRLEAVKKSKKTVPMMVSTGWPVAPKNKVGVIDVIDGSRPRSVAQMLHMHGTAHSTELATSLRNMCMVAYNGASVALTYPQTTYLLDTLGLGAAIERIVSKASSHKDFQGRLVGPLAYYYTAAPQKALAFAESLFNFETVSGSPVQAFLNWVKNHPRPERALRMRALCASLRAWDAKSDLDLARGTPEQVDWLANRNPKLRAEIKRIIPCAGKMPNSL